jgi:hypothetical protein
MRRVLAFVVLLGVGSLTWKLAPDWFRTRIETIGETEEDYNTWSYDGRKQIWARARMYIRERPVTGVGLTNFSVAEGNYLASLGLRGKWSYARVCLQLRRSWGSLAQHLHRLRLAASRAGLRRPPGGWGHRSSAVHRRSPDSPRLPLLHAYFTFCVAA